MKRIHLCLIVCLTVFIFILSGCTGGQNDSEMQSNERETVSSDIQNDKESALQIRVKTDSESIIFALNDSSAARSLYDQLPLNLSQNNNPAQSAESSEQTNTTSTQAESTSPKAEISGTPSVPAVSEETEDNMRNIEITVNGKTFSATLNDNEAARAFAKMLPLTLDMSDYSGFEKVGSLGTSLPASNQQTTTQSGDIVLYNGNQIVIFYGSNSWSYTRLGKIDDLSGWKDALGSGDVTVTFSLED